MWELLSQFNPGQMIGLVSAIGGLLIAAVMIISAQWRRVRQAELQAGLVQQMLERGMSAAEIEQVLRASTRVKRGRALDEALRQRCGAHRPD